jgi:hypothetical protein
MTVVYCLLGSSPASVTPTHLWRWNRYSVLKRRLIKFRRRRTTKKTIYYIHNMAKVWKLQEIWLIGEKQHLAWRKKTLVTSVSCCRNASCTPLLRRDKYKVWTDWRKEGQILCLVLRTLRCALVIRVTLGTLNTHVYFLRKGLHSAVVTHSISVLIVTQQKNPVICTVRDDVFGFIKCFCRPE